MKNELYHEHVLKEIINPLLTGMQCSVLIVTSRYVALESMAYGILGKTLI